jgi:hypothetical protein
VKGKSAFAIDAVKTAYFFIVWQQVDAQRIPKPAAGNRTKNDAIEQKSGHAFAMSLGF